MSGGELRVVLADDHEVVRTGLRALVDASPGMCVVGEARNGEEACRLARDAAPDVLVMDVSMPVMDGAAATERVRVESPGVRVLALTMHDDRAHLTRLLEAGASGYVLKRAAADELVRAIRTVAVGGTYVDPSLAAALLAGPGGVGGPGTDGVAELSAREDEVLRLVARGHTSKEVAAALGISAKTVETHSANAMAKLGLDGRPALVRIAVEQGWLTNR